MTAPESAVRAVRSHRIECSSKSDGTVTCVGCRDRGWMPYYEFIQHQADAAFAASLEWAAGELDRVAHADGILEPELEGLHAFLLRRWARGDR